MRFRYFLLLAMLAGCSTRGPAATVYSAPDEGFAVVGAETAVQLFRQVVRRGEMEVEVERLEEARARLERSLAALGRVEARTVTATEVTEQVVDWEARIAVLRASRDRLRQ